MKGLVISLEASDTLAAERVITLSSGKAAYGASVLTAGGNYPVGISVDDARTGQGLPVQVNGVARLYFNDTVAALGLVASDANGCGIPFAAVTGNSFYVGVLAGAAVAATGTIADVIINPGFHKLV